MSSGCLWCVALLAACCLSMTAGTSPPVVVPPEPEAPAPSLSGEEGSSSDVEAPAGVEDPGEDKRETKRSGHYCVVEGHVFRHGEVFTYPGYSHCLKYRCNNGRYSMVQAACERDQRCIPEGSVFSGQCRSMRCVRHSIGNMLSFHLEPTRNDMCNADGKCVRKNYPFVHSDCHEYECIPTPYGGYRFRFVGSQCMDDRNVCIPVGRRFSKWINGHRYTNCICTHGGGYSCSS